MLSLVEEFMLKIRNRYPDIDFKLMKNNNIFKIYHNNSDLEYKDEQFALYVGELLQKVFIENNVYNIQFSYQKF